MLELYYTSSGRCRQLRRGPLAPYVDRLATELHTRGYSGSSARVVLSFIGHLSRHLEVNRIPIVDLCEQTGEQCITNELMAYGVYAQARAHLRLLLLLLRGWEIIAPASAPLDPKPYRELLAQYDQHLITVRGLILSSRQSYCREAGRFLEYHLTLHQGACCPTAITGTEVLNYLVREATESEQPGRLRHLSGALRAFFRFLQWEEILTHDVAASIPSVKRYRLATLPQHLTPEQVRALIDSVDTSMPVGMRDRAILLVLATLGIRNYDVRTLELRNINWRAGTIHLPKTKSRRARMLPLPAEVGEAIADYLLHGRPPCALPQVFLSHKASLAPYMTGTGISAMVRKRLAQLQINLPARKGTHLLRHSLATNLVNAGVPIKEVADILGHRCIDTTAIYTKVDTRHLAAVALPFPGGVA